MSGLWCDVRVAGGAGRPSRPAPLNSATASPLQAPSSCTAAPRRLPSPPFHPAGRLLGRGLRVAHRRRSRPGGPDPAVRARAAARAGRHAGAAAGVQGRGTQRGHGRGGALGLSALGRAERLQSAFRAPSERLGALGPWGVQSAFTAPSERLQSALGPWGVQGRRGWGAAGVRRTLCRAAAQLARPSLSATGAYMAHACACAPLCVCPPRQVLKQLGQEGVLVLEVRGRRGSDLTRAAATHRAASRQHARHATRRVRAPHQRCPTRALPSRCPRARPRTRPASNPPAATASAARWFWATSSPPSTAKGCATTPTWWTCWTPSGRATRCRREGGRGWSAGRGCSRGGGGSPARRRGCCCAGGAQELLLQ
jgi:hypothetical protein